MPNTFALIALLGWPFVAVYLFVYHKLERAVIWTLLGGFLLLPTAVSIDLPAVPSLNKESIPNIVALALALALAKQKLRLLPEGVVGKLLIALVILAPFATSLTNTDPVVTARTVLPGTRLYDAFSISAAACIGLVPFLLGRSIFRTMDSQIEILRALVFAGLAYSILMLYEVRFSPQLHLKLYGFFPHSFAQQVRWGGFRPVVFLPHGLWLAFFAMTVVVSAAILWRHAVENARGPYLYAMGYLSVVLALCKSLGSIFYYLLVMPLVLFTGPRVQMRVALVLVCLAVAYPALRGGGIIPVQSLAAFALSIDADRAQSLVTRFNQEEALLEKASQRPLFGWGGWGRNRIYNEVTGKDMSLTDGLWVIKIGTGGWIGFLVFFGVLAWPVIALWRVGNQPGAPPLPLIATGLCLLLSINIFEFLPNSTLTPMTWLIAGSLLGYAESLRKGAPETEETPSLSVRQRRRTVI